MSVQAKFRSALQKDTLLRRIVKHVAQPILMYQRLRAINRYNEWFQRQMPTDIDLKRQRESLHEMTYQPLMSIIVPVYNPPIDYFKAMIESVLIQTYPNWELILVDDASPNDDARNVIKQYAQSDSRIKYIFLDDNLHISGATNKGIEMSTGEFISLLDNDDVVYPHTLYEVVFKLNKNPNLDLIYTDEDKIEGSSGIHTSPYFKPDLNPDFLRSVNYITHFTTIRKEVLDKLGYLDGAFNGAQDWELFLRLTRSLEPQNVAHIPKILYSWRVHEASTAANIEAAKPYVIEAQRSALQSDLDARGYKAYDLHQDPMYNAQWIVRLATTSNPSVTSIAAKKDEDLRDIALRVKTEFVALSYGSMNGGGDEIVQWLVSDAQRKDVGFVSSRYPESADVMVNIENMINPDALDLVRGMSSRDVTKHFYTTVKYDIPSVHGISCVVIGTDKLREIVSLLDGKDATLSECNKKASDIGYYNLYNPYARML